MTVPLKHLLPQRGPATAVIMLSIAGIAIQRLARESWATPPT
ncbi:MAG: hypothetical protein ACLP75_04655 [Mycobacterium sp.]